MVLCDPRGPPEHLVLRYWIMDYEFWWNPAWSACWWVKVGYDRWYLVPHSPDGWCDRISVDGPPETGFRIGEMPAGFMRWLAIGTDVGGEG